MHQGLSQNLRNAENVVELAHVALYKTLLPLPILAGIRLLQSEDD